MSKTIRVLDMERCIGCFSCMFACARIVHNSFSPNRSAVHVHVQGGVESQFVVITCRACPDPPCARACPEGALKVREGGGVDLVAEKCIGCGKCSHACIIGALRMDQTDKKPLVCLHCGVCADYCPHQVLALSEGGA